jgi:UDP-glucose 4-epimerase
MAAVLVTGGAGFIGSHLVDALLVEGHAVRVVDNFATGFRKNVAHHGSRIQIIEGDLSAPEIASDVCRDIEIVFHLAALPSVPRSVDNPFATQQSGECATLRLLNSCAEHRIRRVIFAGSSSAYGGTAGLPKTESMVPVPRSPYAASKLACEQYITAFSQYKGVDGITLRYFNVFGPRQDPTSRYSAVITVFLSCMRRGDRPQIFGDGEQSRDFTYVENVVQANLLAMRAPGPFNGTVCNVGCGERISLITLVAMLNAALGTKLEPTFGPARAGDALHSLADIGRARELFGYVPSVRFSEGIKRLIQSQAERDNPS